MIWNMWAIEVDARHDDTALDAQTYTRRAANPRDDFPGDGVGAFRQLRRGNFLLALAAHQNNFVAHRSVRDMRNVDHHQIHRDAPEQRAALPANQHRCVAIREMPRITVGVTGRQAWPPAFRAA